MPAESVSAKTFVVTGASSGIGAAICELLLQQGHSVAAISRDPQRLVQHDNLTGWSMDFSRLGDVPAAARQLAAAIPPIDGVILSAGYGQFGSLEEFSHQQIETLMNVNFTGQVSLLKELLPGMKRRQSGQIIVIGSSAALLGERYGAVYCASKFALKGLAQALRHECARSGVRVSLVNPGMADTAFYDQLSFAPGDGEENHLTAMEIAQAVLFVVNARADSVIDELNLSPRNKVIIKKK